jgi:hypothetical protein
MASAAGKPSPSHKLPTTRHPSIHHSPRQHHTSSSPPQLQPYATLPHTPTCAAAAPRLPRPHSAPLPLPLPTNQASHPLHADRRQHVARSAKPNRLRDRGGAGLKAGRRRRIGGVIEEHVSNHLPAPHPRGHRLQYVIPVEGVQRFVVSRGHKHGPVMEGWRGWRRLSCAQEQRGQATWVSVVQWARRCCMGAGKGNEGQGLPVQSHRPSQRCTLRHGAPRASPAYPVSSSPPSPPTPRTHPPTHPRGCNSRRRCAPALPCRANGPHVTCPIGSQCLLDPSFYDWTQPPSPPQAPGGRQ